MSDKIGYVKIEDVLELDTQEPIGKTIGEEIDNRIAEEIAAIIKKYFPQTTTNKERVLKLSKRLLEEENDV